MAVDPHEGGVFISRALLPAIRWNRFMCLEDTRVLRVLRRVCFDCKLCGYKGLERFLAELVNCAAQLGFGKCDHTLRILPHRKSL